MPLPRPASWALARQRIDADGQRSEETKFHRYRGDHTTKWLGHGARSGGPPSVAIDRAWALAVSRGLQEGYQETWAHQPQYDLPYSLVSTTGVEPSGGNGVCGRRLARIRWGPVAERGVTALAVVRDLDVLEDRVRELDSGLPIAAVEELDLKRRRPRQAVASSGKMGGSDDAEEVATFSSEVTRRRSLSLVRRKRRCSRLRVYAGRGGLRCLLIR